MRVFKFNEFFLVLGLLVFLLISCKRDIKKGPAIKKAAIEVKTAVVEIRNIKEYLDFNGVTQYQKKERLRAQSTGYVNYLPFERGDRVQRGTTFATLRTKEQSALEDAVKIDSSLAPFAKPLRITAHASGIITQLNVVKGDYVAEGDVLGVIVQPKTLVVKVNVPFGDMHGIDVGTACEVIVPDPNATKVINTEITAKLPTIDSVNQTQDFLIALPDQQLPERLNVKVRTVLGQDSTALSIPYGALQTNELMTDFWVMKVLNDTLATKEQVVPLLQNDSVVQINSARVKEGDRVVTEGSYQMQDSTRVKIIKQ